MCYLVSSNNNYNGSSDCQESAKRSSVMAVAQQYYSLGNATVVHAFGNCRSLYFIVLKKHLDRYWAMSIERSQASTASGLEMQADVRTNITQIGSPINVSTRAFNHTTIKLNTMIRFSAAFRYHRIHQEVISRGK